MSGRYALLVGNTEYDDARLARLTAPGKDAEDLAKVLSDGGLCAFDDVKVLVNQTEPIVRAAIDEFFDQKGPQDLLLLYFSGHGVRDEQGALYLAVKNTNRVRLRSTAIKSDFIHEAMEQSRARRQVLILDCCNSGAFEQGTKAAAGGSVGTATAFGGGYGRIILTASDSLQYAWQGEAVIGEMKNSLFTHYLVEGLKGEAEVDGNGCITVDALYDYAYEKVRLATPNQTPSKFSSKQEGEIVLRQITRIEQIKAAPLPAPLLESLENPFAAIRLGAVQELARLFSGKNLGLARAAREALERLEKDDDSRAVQEAARKVLEPYRQAELSAASTTGQPDQSKADEERMAAEKAQRERLAAEQAAMEQRAREAAKRQAEMSAEKERRAREAAAAIPVTVQENASPQAIATPAKQVKPLPKTVYLYGGALIVLLLIVGLLLNAQRKPGGIPAVNTTAADSSAIGTTAAHSTRTALAEAASTASAATAFMYKATSAAATSTALARATSVAMAAEATRLAENDFAAKAQVAGKQVYGPYSAKLGHNASDQGIRMSYPNVNYTNFIAQATFVNPFPTSMGQWDYGFTFRDEIGNSDRQYRIYVVSNKRWAFSNFAGVADAAMIASGPLTNLDTGDKGQNTIRLICWNDRGLFYVNRDLIATLDLSARQNSGDVGLGTGFLSGDEINGKFTQFKDFTIWSLP